MAIRTRRALAVPAIALGFGLAAAAALRSQSPALSITLTGQSTIRTDVRVHTPSITSTVAPLLTGDVVFTNFEAAVLEKDQSPRDGQFLSPPEAIDALKAVGFNLLSLANNHSWDLKVAGIQNTLRAVDRLGLAHAGTGNTIDEASGAGYLRTPKGTVALVAMASGFVPEGGSATPTRPGVNELRIDGGKTANREDAERILKSIRAASGRADSGMERTCSSQCAYGELDFDGTPICGLRFYGAHAEHRGSAGVFTWHHHRHSVPGSGTLSP
jgi:poly-gamma-glutamate synthesis protein (capsule biosynthesis protein)